MTINKLGNASGCADNGRGGESYQQPCTAVSAAIQQAQRNSISINETRNEITLAHTASQASTSNKIGVSCNCKKGCGTRRCRPYKNILKYSGYCHKKDYVCGNLKPLTERTEISLMLRESWEVLDDSAEEENSVGDT